MDMDIEDRIARWREGEEDEGHVELLCDAEEELRGLRGRQRQLIEVLQRLYRGAVTHAAWADARFVLAETTSVLTDEEQKRALFAFVPKLSGREK